MIDVENCYDWAFCRLELKLFNLSNTFKHIMFIDMFKIEGINLALVYDVYHLKCDACHLTINSYHRVLLLDKLKNDFPAPVTHFLLFSRNYSPTVG